MKEKTLLFYSVIFSLLFVDLLCGKSAKCEDAPCEPTAILLRAEKGSETLADSDLTEDTITESILKNVETLSIKGRPGFLTVYGESAESVLAGRFYSDKDVYHTIVAAGPLGKGRIVGCSHTNFLQVDNETDNLEFIFNMARWASSKENGSFSLAILQDDEDESLVDFFQSRKVSATTILWDALNHVEHLEDFNVVLTSEFFPQSKVDILEEFSKIRGGGLVIALTPWESPLADEYEDNPAIHFGLTFPANQLAAAAGFVWRGVDRYAKPTTPFGHYNASKEFVKNTHFRTVCTEISKFVEGSGSETFGHAPLQFKTNFEEGIKSIPPAAEFFSSQDFKRLRNALEKNQPIPTAENPIVNETEKLCASLHHLVIKFAVQPQDILPHPASQFFPGNVQNSSSKSGSQIQRVHLNLPPMFRGPKWREKKEKVEVNRRHSRWFTTGLYAPPGVTIRIWSSSNPAEVFIPLKVQIGCHTDDISSRDEWKRLPQITTTFSSWKFEGRSEVTRAQRSGVMYGDLSLNFTVASPYGGLLYVILPPEANMVNQSSIELFVQGAVRAPHFKLGQTPLKRWREKNRFNPGPWAEFESDKIIFTIPSSIAREIMDPESILHFWDLVMDAISDLLGIRQERVRKERIVADIQIEAGSLHAGYPIMSHLEDAQVAVDLKTLRNEGSWGHFHELGHNYQRDAWTFSGTEEVTCNVIVLYIQNTVLGIATEKQEDMRPEEIKERISTYIESGLNFDLWKEDHWLGLAFYYQLQLNYGWEAYKNVFSWYNDNVNVEHESKMKDDEIIDLWLVTFSKVTGEDLSPFFESWGIPFSANASEQIKYLPPAPIRLIDMLNR